MIERWPANTDMPAHSSAGIASPRIAQRGCGRANPDVMSESHAEPDVELVRENRNRGMESKKGRGWEELRNSQT